MKLPNVLNLGAGLLLVEIIDGCAHLEWRGVMTLQAVHDGRQQMLVLNAVQPWCCAVVDFRRAVFALDPQGVMREFALPTDISSRPTAWVVKPADLPQFDRLALHLAALGLCRQAFSDAALALAWAQARAEVWLAEAERHRGKPARRDVEPCAD